MKKIISLYQRNYDGDKKVRDEVVPGAEWVLAGEGAATRKWDGTSCLIRKGKLYKRYDNKRGRTPPDDFTPAQDADPITGHQTGWVPVKWEPANLYHLEAWFENGGKDLPDGTYELLGPKVQTNADNAPRHALVAHGWMDYDDRKEFDKAPRTYNELKEWLQARNYEGIVWHHSDGRMVKIKKKDFPQ